jgi:resuscitation-promoting factor RpfA
MNRNDPLSPEERDLAGRLARLGGPREPSAALDAAILAAARAAVAPQPAESVADAPDAPTIAASTTATSTASTAPATADADALSSAKVVPLAAAAKPKPKPRPRWPLGLGLAASLTLAATIGLRVLDAPDGGGNFDTTAAESAQSVATADAAAAEDSVTEAVMIDPPLQRTAPPPPPPLEAAPAGGFAAKARRDAAVDAETDAAARYRYEPNEARAAAEALSSAPRPLPPPPPAPMAPPPPPVASAPAASAAPAAAARAANAFPEQESAERRAERNQLNERPREAKVADDDKAELDQVQVTGSRIRKVDGAAAPATPLGRAADASAQKTLNEEYDDQPPLSADAPEVRQAWLQRIRRLVAEGKTEAARESLAEFRRRYPTAELPDDLKKLAATLPPTTP